MRFTQLTSLSDNFQVADLIRGAAHSLDSLFLDTREEFSVPLDCLSLCARLRHLTANTSCVPALPHLGRPKSLRLYMVLAESAPEAAAERVSAALRSLERLAALRTLSLDLWLEDGLEDGMEDEDWRALREACHARAVDFKSRRPEVEFEFCFGGGGFGHLVEAQVSAE